MKSVRTRRIVRAIVLALPIGVGGAFLTSFVIVIARLWIRAQSYEEPTIILELGRLVSAVVYASLAIFVVYRSKLLVRWST